MKKKDFVSLILSVVGGILFALGMCMALLPEWGAMTQGIVIGVIGLAVLLVMVMVRRKMDGKPAIVFNGKAIAIPFPDDRRNAVGGGVGLGQHHENTVQAHDSHQDHVEVGQERQDHAGLGRAAVDPPRAHDHDQHQADIEEQGGHRAGKGHNIARGPVLAGQLLVGPLEAPGLVAFLGKGLDDPDAVMFSRSTRVASSTFCCTPSKSGIPLIETTATAATMTTATAHRILTSPGSMTRVRTTLPSTRMGARMAKV